MFNSQWSIVISHSWENPGLRPGLTIAVTKILAWQSENIGGHMFIALFVILLLLWIFGFTAFHVAGFAIHLLLILAIISLIVHFVRPHGAGPTV
jgi:hypothetical protein